MKPVQRHAVVENWDDDFADEDEDDNGLADAHMDVDTHMDTGLEGDAAGPSLILSSAFPSDVRGGSTSRLGLASPRSVHSLRPAHVAGLDAACGMTREESDSDSDEESWDDDDDAEDQDQDHDEASGEARVDVEERVSREVCPAQAPRPEPAPEAPRCEPVTPTFPSTADASQPQPPSSHDQIQSPPPPSTTTPMMTLYPVYPSFGASSSPSLPLPPPPPPFSPVSSSPPPSHQNETEFGAKPHSKGDEEAEIEDEDATITARSRPRRRARPVPSVNDVLVPPVPIVATTTASPALVLSAPGSAAGRAPVFSPPVSTKSSSSSPSSGAPPSTASSACPFISSPARPSTSSSTRPPTTSSMRPSTSSSARPSASSSARPSSSSSARPSASSPSGKSTGTGLRPHLRPTSPKTQAQPPAQAQAQRSSIASLLSVYTHRSRASSVSAFASGSSGPDSRRTSTAESNSGSSSSNNDALSPRASRASLSSWTQRLFSPGQASSSNNVDVRTRQSLDERARRVSVEGRGVGGHAHAGRQSLDVLREGRARRGAGPAVTAVEKEGERGGGGGDKEQTKSGVLGFFGRRKRSNTVAAAMPESGTGKESREEVYANRKASKSQRSLLLLGRAPSLLARRTSRVGKGKGKETEKDRGVDGGVEAQEAGAEDDAKPGLEAVFSPHPRSAAADTAQGSTTLQLAPRGTKRRIPSGRASLPLIVPAALSDARDEGPRAASNVDSILVMPERQAQGQRTPERSALQRHARSPSHSTSTSLSSIGELRIPSRISQAQVSIRRDLGLVKEFAGKVAELKDLQGSYLQMIESVQGMIDADSGQTAPVAVKAASRPRSNTSPALSRPPSRSPLAALFQGPDHSSNAAVSDSPSPSPSPVTPTPTAPSTPSSALCSSADLAERMADITARYDSWWECAELLIELGNTPPSVPTPVSTVRLAPPTAVVAAPPPPSATATATPTPVAAVASESQQLVPAASVQLTSSSSSSNHAESTLKPSRGRANTFAGHIPVARLRSASTSTASMAQGAAPHPLLSPCASAASSAPSHTWRATTGRHDLSQRQLVLLRQMLGVDQRQQQRSSPAAAVDSADGDRDLLDGEDEESDVEDATWRWGHANTVQLPSPAEEQEAYFGVAGRKKAHRRPWNRAYHSAVAHSEDEDDALAVYVTPPTEPAETKKSKGMNAIRDMLRTLKRAHPPTPRSSAFPLSAEAPPSAAAAPKMSLESARPVFNAAAGLAPGKHAIRRAASLLPLSATAPPPSRVPSSSSSSVSRASKIDPTLAFAMTPDNIKPLLDNAREVRARLGECVADVQALLASAGVDAVPG